MIDTPYSYWPTAAYQTTQTTSQTARTKEEAREDFEQPDVYLIVPNAYCAKPVQHLRYRTYQGSRIILIEAPADYVSGHADTQSVIYGEAAGTTHLLDGEDLLDWDFALASAPPASASGVVEVQLEYAGWSTPIPVDSPWTE